LLCCPDNKEGVRDASKIIRSRSGAFRRNRCGLVAGVGRPDVRCREGQGFVQCAVNTGLAGFSLADSQGKWTGLDVDLCKAIAAAMFGDAEKAKFTPTTAQQRFVALQSGEVDVITRNATQTLLRDTSLGFNIAGVNFYDGQGFLVPAKSNLKSAKELAGATICVQPGTTTELNLADYFRKQKMTFKPVLIEKLDELLQYARPL